MSEALDLYNACGNPGCRSKLPLQMSKCHDCSTPVETRMCSQCFQHISNFDDTCPFCNHLVKNPPKYIPCILCQFTLLEVSNSDTCYRCGTPQDYSVLLNMKFKGCTNSHCVAILRFESLECHHCMAHQSTSAQLLASKAISFKGIKCRLNSNLLRHLKSKVQAKRPPSSAAFCSQCFRPISFCPSCEHVLVNAPRFIPCIVCNEMLETTNCSKCIKCTTPQDYSVLQTMLFKVCSTCARVIPCDMAKCCFCNQQQPLVSVEPITFEKLPVNSFLLEHLKSRPAMLVEGAKAKLIANEHGISKFHRDNIKTDYCQYDKLEDLEDRVVVYPERTRNKSQFDEEEQFESLCDPNKGEIKQPRVLIRVHPSSAADKTHLWQKSMNVPSDKDSPVLSEHAHDKRKNVPKADQNILKKHPLRSSGKSGIYNNIYHSRNAGEIFISNRNN